MTAGLLQRFQGVVKTESVAAIMPPMRQLILLGAIFVISKAGGTKLATMLIPIVATTNVKAPKKTAVTESNLPTTSTGSVIISPNTGTVSEIVITVTIAKAR